MGQERLGPSYFFILLVLGPLKHPVMVRTFLKVYMELGSYFVSARTNKRHHHQRCPRDPHRQTSPRLLAGVRRNTAAVCSEREEMDHSRNAGNPLKPLIVLFSDRGLSFGWMSCWM